MKFQILLAAFVALTNSQDQVLSLEVPIKPVVPFEEEPTEHTPKLIRKLQEEVEEEIQVPEMEEIVEALSSIEINYEEMEGLFDQCFADEEEDGPWWDDLVCVMTTEVASGWQLWDILPDGTLMIVLAEAVDDSVKGALTATLARAAVTAHTGYRHKPTDLLQRVSDTLW